MWNEYPPDYFDKDIWHDGTVNLFGVCEISSQGDKGECAIDKVFGVNKQELTWNEFFARCPDDTFGICPKGKLLEKILESADKVIAKWLDAVGGNSNRSTPVNVRAGSVIVYNGGIEFDFRCDYEFYYEQTIDQYTNEEKAWDEDTDVLIKCLNDACDDMGEDDVWAEIYFNDYDFDAN